MIRDFSVDLYVTDSEERSPGSCDELGFIVRASSVQHALDLALKKKAEAHEWYQFRVFEANAQEIERSPLSDVEAAYVITGPHPQSLVREKKRSIFGFLKK